MNNSVIPPEWAWSELTDLFVHVIGGDWGKDINYVDNDYIEVFCIRGAEFRHWDRDKGKTATLRKIKWSSLETRRLALGDIIIEISGGGPEQPVGRTVLIDKSVFLNHQIQELVCTNFLRLARPNKYIDSYFLNGYLRSFYLSGEVKNYQGGSNNLRNLKFKDFERILIPIPPVDEQKQIAAKLDKLLAQVDTLKARLDAFPGILKRFRQSVLAAAVSGRLTEEWRRNNSRKTTAAMLRTYKPLPKPRRYKSRSRSFIHGVYATAVGKPDSCEVTEWEWVPIVDIARMESGHTPSRSKQEYWDGNISWIGIKDARNNQEKTILETLQHTNELGLANSASRLLPENTICISRTASVGYVVKMGSPMATSQDFVNWIPSKVVNPDWLKWLFVAEKESLFRFGKGSTHTTVYFPEWLSMHIALPHIDEQTEIVRRVDQLFAYADQIEQRLEQARGRVDQLTQSILARAFHGELTAEWREQNPALISGENSAEALLARIEAEKANSKPVKRPRRKRTG